MIFKCLFAKTSYSGRGRIIQKRLSKSDKIVIVLFTPHLDKNWAVFVQIYTFYPTFGQKPLHYPASAWMPSAMRLLEDRAVLTWMPHVVHGDLEHQVGITWDGGAGRGLIVVLAIT